MANELKLEMARQIAFAELKKLPEYKFSTIPSAVFDEKMNEYLNLSEPELQRKIAECFNGSEPQPDGWDLLGLNLISGEKSKVDEIMKLHADSLQEDFENPEIIQEKYKRQNTQPVKFTNKQLQNFTLDVMFSMLSASSKMLHQYHDDISYISGNAAWQGLKNIANLATFGNVETIWKEMDKIDNILLEVIKLKNNDNPKSFEKNFTEFKKIFKEFTGIDYNPENIQNFVAAAQKDIPSDSEEYKAVLKDAFGKDYSQETMDSISSQQTKGAVMDIVMLVAGTGAISSTKMFANFASKAIALSGRVGGSMIAGAAQMGGFNAAMGTVNLAADTVAGEILGVSYKQYDSSEYLEKVKHIGISTLEGAGFGGFGGLLNTTVVSKVVNMISKGETVGLGKAAQFLANNSEVTAQDLMTTFINGSKPGVVAKAAGFVTEVAGFTGYEIALDIAKDIASGKSNLPQNYSLDDVTQYVGSKFKNQVKMLGEIKVIGQLVMMMQGGRAAKTAIFNSRMKNSNLENYKIRTIESEGKPAYEVTTPEGNTYTASTPEQLIGGFFTMMNTPEGENKDGTSYTEKIISSVKEKTKDAILNHTSIGRKVREGYRKAKTAARNNFHSTKESSFSRVKEQIKTKMQDMPLISEKLMQDKEFMRLFNSFVLKNAADKPELMELIKNYDFSGMNDAKIIKMMIETSGVGITKFAQIISKDKTIMSNFERTLPPEEFKSLQEALINCQSKCDFSRTPEQAQAELNKAFPQRGGSSQSEYVITKENSAGSVGATYWAKDSNGKKVIVKMLKAGVDMEELGMEEKLFKKLIEVFAATPADAVKYSTMIHNQYKDWLGELDFKQEGINNKRLTQGAQRYTVAQVQKVSRDGTILIMDKAQGVQMNKLMEMLESYKTDPEGYAAKYKQEISDNPWLSAPKKILGELPATLVKTFDEQMLFMKKGGETVMHGDPHMGNLFVYDSKGKLKIEFIDTGNCVIRNSDQIKGDIAFFSNYLVGNSEGVAKYFMKKGGVSPEAEPDLLKHISENIDKRVFKKGENITEFANVQKELNAILEEAGLDIGSEDSNALKAQLQFISNVSALNSLSGKPLDVGPIFADIPKALMQMARNGVNPLASVKDAVSYAYNNKVDALATALQFKVKKHTAQTEPPTDMVLVEGTSKRTFKFARETLHEIRNLVKNRHNLTDAEIQESIGKIAANARVVKSQIEDVFKHLTTE